MFKSLIFSFIFLFSNLLAQGNFELLDISINNSTKQITSYKSGEMHFVSVREFSKLLNKNYFFNSDTKKAEIKFEKFNLIITAWNQFIIINSRSSDLQKVFQLPISPKLIDNDIYFPFSYSAKYFEMASDYTIEINQNENKIEITSNSISNQAENQKSKTSPNLTKEEYDIQSIEIEEKSNGTLIKLKTNSTIKNIRHSLLEEKLILFLQNKIRVNPKITEVKPEGLVKEVKLKKVSGNYQVEFELHEGFTSYDVFTDEETGEIIVSIQNDKFNATTNEFGSQKKEFKLDVIVIDPGHGGKDAGAIGVTSVREKDVNLAIAKKLKWLIKENLPEIDVVLTRENDTFIELYKRGKIANEANGDLFISIHCNSTPKKPSNASGFEVYLLRPGKTEDAIAIAEFENSVINMENHPEQYEELTEENFILVTMAQAANMRFSEKISEILTSRWKSEQPTASRGIKQAGLLVLVGASMPAILIETGFLSNYNDEKYLNSQIGQQKIAQTILNSIIEYKKYYNELNK